MEKIKDTPRFDIMGFIKAWNEKYPYDRWWRKKYGIPFGSKKHREASFIEMSIEYKEDIYFQKLGSSERDKDGIEDEIDRIISEGKGGAESSLKSLKMSSEEISEEFDSIDLDELNKNVTNG
jgi:hypothetical protein